MDTCIQRRTARARWAAVVACLAISLAPASALAENTASSMANGLGIGAASAISSLLYGPTKIVYATGGVLVGGLGWIFSGGDGDVASSIISPAVYGDYVVSPDVLRGERPLEFYGRAPGYSSGTGNVATAPPDDW